MNCVIGKLTQNLVLTRNFDFYIFGLKFCERPGEVNLVDTMAKTPWPTSAFFLTMSIPFKATMYPSSNGYFQQDNIPCQKAHIILNWFLEHDKEVTVLQ